MKTDSTILPEGRCPKVQGQTQCCLNSGHKGMHMFRCTLPGCTGWPWANEVLKHPCKDPYGGEDIYIELEDV